MKTKNVPIVEELHRKLKEITARKGLKINKVLEELIKNYITQEEN